MDKDLIFQDWLNYIKNQIDKDYGLEFILIIEMINMKKLIF